LSGRAATRNRIPGKYVLSVGQTDMPAPAGWVWTRMTDVARLETGHTPSRAHAEYWDGDIPWIGIRDARENHGRTILETRQTVTQLGLDNSASRLLPDKTVCLSRTASIGYSLIMGRPMATSQDFVNWICSEALDPQYLMHLFVAERDSLLEFGKGTTHKTIYFPEVKAFQVCLPPLAEQKRIVSKIEALQERSSRAREALAVVGPLLQQFRQSVLAAAFRGDITADWRSANPHVEPATELLQRIRAERRQRWEQAELAKYEAKGKKPPKGWKDKYKETEPVDDSELPELPDGWCWTSIDTLTFDGPQNGLYVPKAKYGSGTPILRIDDYQIDWCRPSSSLQQVNIDDATATTYGLCAGDLVVNRVNSPSHLGKSIVIEESSIPAVFESNMMRLELADVRVANFCHFFLTSTFGKSLLTRNAKWAVNQASINQGDVVSTPIPLAPIDEQGEVLRMITEAQDAAKRAASDVAESELALTQLDQSILAKAFRGELVPQDPRDEPASVLLERIRASREANKDNGKPSRRRTPARPK